MNAISVDVEISDKLKKAKLENDFYNLIDGERVSAGKTLSVVNPATGNQLAMVPDIDRVLLNKAVSTARKAFSGWRAVPFSQRRAILTSLLDKISEHGEELIVLLTDLRHRKNISVSEIDTYKSAKTIWHYIFARLTG